MMKKTALLMAVFVSLVFGLLKEGSAAPYYEGKVLKIIVGHEAGAGYDLIARLLGKHLPKHIPGKPTIIVENMPGAQSMIALNYVYRIVKPDGLTICSFDRGLPFAQLLNLDGVQFDLRKIGWIGSAASESMILALRTDLPYKTFQDLLKAKQPIPLAAGGAGTSDYQFSTLLKEFAGLNATIINYVSSATEMLAIERKEVDGRAGSVTSLKPLIDRGVVRPLVRSRVAAPGFESLPVNEDLTSDKTGKAIMAMLATADRIGRPYAAPPKTPADLLAILQEAFSKAIKDPELQEEAKRRKVALNYTKAEESLQVINYVLNQPPEVAREFGKYIK